MCHHNYLLDPKRTVQIGIRGSLYTKKDYE